MFCLFRPAKLRAIKESLRESKGFFKTRFAQTVEKSFLYTPSAFLIMLAEKLELHKPKRHQKSKIKAT
jgi:hypothetical protein